MTSTVYEFRLPDVGEGLTEAEILSWLVVEGQEIDVNTPLVQIETAKAAVEIPAPHAGRIACLLVAEGATVAVGTAIVRIDLRDNHGHSSRTPDTRGGQRLEPEDAGEEPPMLVGYGARRLRPEPPKERPERGDVRHAFNEQGLRVAAKPPVRRLARELGVELAQVHPTGPGGIVSRDDVLRASARPPVHALSGNAHHAMEARIPVRGVRKRMAEAMVSSAFTAPHVTEFVAVDVTPTMELLDRIRERPEFSDVRLSILPVVARALVAAIGANPEANSSWDEHAQEIVVHPTVNLGIAVATPRGLLVPNIRAAERLSLLALATEIQRIAEDARSGRSTPTDLSGGTITISNIGVFGIDTGTPILNPGEAAILAIGAATRRPWVVGRGADERVAIRDVVQLALSFDHRILDGATGSKVLAHIAGTLSDPGLAML